MRRIIVIVISAIVGSSAGYLAHQVLSRKDDPALDQQLIIGAPVTVLVTAALLGFISGRRGPVMAFVGGLVAATLLGTRLDDTIPGVATARRRNIEQLTRPPAG